MNNPEKKIVEGESLDPDRCREQDWGGATPVIIRAYRYSSENESTSFVGSAILASGELREVSDLGDMTEFIFPARIGRDDATPAQNQRYLGCLWGRSMNSTYGPHYTFEVVGNA